MAWTPFGIQDLSSITPVSAAYMESFGEHVYDLSIADASLTEVQVVTPEQFGGAGDGVVDNTAALRLAIDALAVGGGKIKFGPGTYLVDGAPITTRMGNAILPLPLTVTAQAGFPSLSLPAIIFEGAGSGLTRIKTTRITDTYSATNGPPSIIGGPTWEQTYDPGPPVVHTNNPLPLGCHIKGIDFEVRVDTASGTSGPRISALDFGCLGRATVDNCEIWTTQRTLEPKNRWTFGLRTPGTFNNGRHRFTDIRIFGFFAGCCFGTSHTNFDQITCSFAKVAFAFDAQRIRTDPHVTIGKYCSTGTSQVHWGGWDPSVGVTDLGTTPQQQYFLSILCWDNEDAVPGGWQTTTSHFYDPTNQVYGIINFNRTLQDAGTRRGLSNVGYGGGPGLIFDGGANVTFRDLTLGGVETRDASYSIDIAGLTTMPELPPHVRFVEVTGAAAITTMSPGLAQGEIHTLMANSNDITIANGATIKLGGGTTWGGANSINDTLTIAWNGVVWVEISRSVNGT